MNQTIKILHINPEYEVTYLIYGPGSPIQSKVPLNDAISLLKTVDFDLILSEPQNQAILNKQTSSAKLVGSTAATQPSWGATQSPIG